MKVLQLGYGNYGKFHAEAWLQLGHSLQVVDPAKAGVSHLREYPRSASTKDSVVKAKVGDWKDYDILDICTPPNTHLGVLEWAVEGLSKAGHGNCRIFIEKPLEVNSTNVFPFRTVVGYGYRFVPGIERLKRLKPTQMKIEWYGKKRPNWTYEDLIRNDGVHVFDLFKYITNRYPTKEEYFISNTIKGDYPDPVLPGCKTTKMVKSEAGIVDFSTVHPVVLLMEQFKALEENSPKLHTLKESIELTKFTNEILKSG